MDHQPTTHKGYFFSYPFLIKRELVYTIPVFIILISSSFIFDFRGAVDPDSFFRIFSSSQTKPRPQESLRGACDYSSGRWVRDESYQFPSYTEDCPFLDPGFRCRRCGRKDVEYLNWRWQPEGCDIVRFSASDLLERSRNGRIIFAGDSIGRNQWESFLCMLVQGVSNISTVYEENGWPLSKHKGFLSMRFSEHNLTVEYYRAPFLVVIGRPPKNSASNIKVTIKLDRLHWFSRKWAGADVLVLNGGHWWNEYKTVKMGCYYEEAGKVNMTMSATEAFQRSLQTWKSWATENLNPEKSHVFFRSYSPVHYRNGTWNDGGRCDMDVQPETNNSGQLEPNPIHNQYISDAIRQMAHGHRKVHFLNITHLSQFRYDGHPSLHREPGTVIPAPQDCSHWCLPGIPDIWNEILYAELLSMGFRTKQNIPG